jgi:hypothetical protein
MTVKIMQAVAILVLQEGKTLFAPEEIRQTIGVDHERWGRSYRQFLHAMRVDPPSSAPHIRAKFKGVFRRVERGVYTLTDDGRRLLLTEFKAHALPHSVEQATTAEMQQVTKPSGTPPGEVPTTARDSLPQTTREAMNAKIMRAVAILVLQDGNQEFSREEIRQTIGVDRQKWNYSYTPTFQGMRVDQPGGAPDVRAKFKGVFRRVERGRYTLTEYGKRLLLAEFKAHGLPPAVEQATAKVMPETTSVLTFDNDEAGYLQWVAANAHGYVINAPKRSGDFPDILHRASCIHISSPQRTNYTTTDFKKICSLDRQALVDWGTRYSDDFRECKHCKP